MRVQHEPILQENPCEKEDELLQSPRWHSRRCGRTTTKKTNIL